MVKILDWPSDTIASAVSGSVVSTRRQPTFPLLSPVTGRQGLPPRSSISDWLDRPWAWQKRSSSGRSTGSGSVRCASAATSVNPVRRSTSTRCWRDSLTGVSSRSWLGCAALRPAALAATVRGASRFPRSGIRAPHWRHGHEQVYPDGRRLLRRRPRIRRRRHPRGRVLPLQSATESAPRIGSPTVAGSCGMTTHAKPRQAANRTAVADQHPECASGIDGGELLRVAIQQYLRRHRGGVAGVSKRDRASSAPAIRALRREAPTAGRRRLA